MGFFYVFLFQTLIKGKHIPILWFVTCYYLVWPLKFEITQNLVRNKKKFANWAVDGVQYAFHEIWLRQQNFSNLRVSKAPSKKI